MHLTFSSRINDPAFAIFINEIKKNVKELGINDLMVLSKVRTKQNIEENDYKESLKKMMDIGIILREKGGRKGKFEFAEKYQDLFFSK